jgi:endonuclease YncB( thermonuclease family)
MRTHAVVTLSTIALLAAAGSAEAATVARVVDGDTVKVRDGGKTRSVDLAGIDAPETGACQGAEAKRGLAKLLPVGAAVKLVRDAKAPASARYVFRKGKLVNVAVVRAGLARASADGLSKRASLLAAEQAAQKAGKGVWTCAAPPSSGTPPTGQQAIDRARTDLADKMFTKIETPSVLRTTENRLHLCKDGYAAYDTFYSSGATDVTSSSRSEGQWEVVSAAYTATTATARVRLFNASGELFLDFFADGRRVSINGVDQTEFGSSDLCAVRTGG